MSVEILSTRQADLQAVTEFLKDEWDDYIAPAAGEPVHVGNWLEGSDNYGLRLMVDGKLAGFLGASYSARPVDGGSEIFCAIAPWYVKAEYRSHSLPMLFKLIADRSITYVNLTPTRDMSKLFRTLGFQKLDDVKLLAVPLMNLATFRPWRGRLVSDPVQIRAVLAGGALRLFDAHAKSRCCHLAVVADGKAGYLAAAKRTLKNLPFAEILHLDAPDLFAPQFERVVWQLCRRIGAVGVSCDARFIGGANVMTLPYRLNAPPLFRSPRLAREKVDNMWSELVL